MNKRKKKKTESFEVKKKKAAECETYLDDIVQAPSPAVKEEISRYTYKAQVTVVDKKVSLVKSGKHHFTVRTLSCQFADGSRKDINVPERKAGLDRSFDLTVKNDTGVLIYVENGDFTQFCSFERDNDRNNTELNLYEKIYKTGGGHNLLHAILVVAGMATLLKLLMPFLQDTGKPLTMPMLIFLFVFSYGITALILWSPYLYGGYKLKNMPEKKEWAKVVGVRGAGPGEVRHGSMKNIYVFEFADGLRKSFVIRPADLQDLPKRNQTGTLIYQQSGNEVRFIRFERGK